MHKRLTCAAALSLTTLVILLVFGMHAPSAQPLPPAGQLQPVRVWIMSAPGGGESWLRACLRQWEAADHGRAVYLRSVAPEELTRQDGIPPDIVLYTQGDVTAPQAHFAPIDAPDGLREPLLRAGRWQGEQYGLPLCYAAYALAIDSALEPHAALTPAPTTLLGRPAATAAPEPSHTPGYPLERALQADIPLAAPKGAALFALCSLLPAENRPPLDKTTDAYSLFRQRKASTAMLTTGQLTALRGLQQAGKAFPYRVMTADEVITDQVWMASLCTGASGTAADLLAHLLSPGAQKLLTSQCLYTARADLKLYPAGMEDQVERAGARSLTAINAYVPKADVDMAAWQAAAGQCALAEALLPLL